MAQETKLFVSAAAAAILAGAPYVAFAQAAAKPEAQSGQVAQLEEVIVTAERRSTDVQRTAISVTALSGDALISGGATNAQSLILAIPAVHLTNQSPIANIYVRGVGGGVSNSYGDPGVAYNVDGVYIARPFGNAATFYDLDRVELLKGPQGTLYGRNATAGAINIISKKPTFDLGGEASLQIGNYNDIETSGVVNAPLGDKVAARVAFKTIKHDGYLTNGYNDADTVATRGKLLIKPNEDVSLLLSADYFRDTGSGPSDVPVYSTAGQKFINPDNPWQGLKPLSQGGPASAAFVPGVTPGTMSLVGDDGYVRDKQTGVSAELNWRTAIGDLTVLPAYRETDIHYLDYLQGFQQQVDNLAKQKSLEARLASNSEGPLTWIIGGFYFHETQDSTLKALQNNGFFTIRNPNLLDASWAVFGQATYKLTDRLRLTGGLRYTEEHKSQDGYTILPFTGQIVANCVSPGVYSAAAQSCTIPNGGDLKFNATTWKAGVEFDVAERSLLYANISKGYKAGGFWAGLAPNTYLPEELLAYEVGSKNRFLDNRLQVNVNAFYWDYTNQQVTSFNNLNPAGFTITIANADSHIYGAEGEFAFAPTANDRLTADIAYTKGVFDRYALPLFTITLANGAVVPIQPAANFKGVDRPFTPKWSMSLRYDHTFDLASGGKVVAGLGSHIESSTWLAVTHRVGEYRSSYHMSDADLTYHDPEDKWSVSAFVNNIENEDVLTSSTRSPVTTTPATLEFAGIMAPRTYGLRLSAKF